MKVIDRNISELIPAEYNPRYISPEALEHLKASIQRFDAVEPVLINTHPDRKNIIISGHQRIKAAKSLGLETFPCVELELDKDKERELNIRMNKNTGTWDWDELATYFDVDELTDWGFTEEELFADGFEEEPEAEEDDYEIPDEVHTDFVLGDLIEIGEHRLLCGDSTDSDAVAKLMDGEKADMVFTDPPYGIDYDDSRWDEIQKNHTGGKSKKFGKIKNDDDLFNPSFLLSLFSYCKEIFVWGMQYYPQHLGRGGCIVWNRKAEAQKDVPYVDFELCWSKQERNKMAWIQWGGFKNKETGDERYHPTQKPIKLAEFFFNNWGKEGDLVADLFLGSGSTMVACHQLNRKCYGCELDPKYCQVIVDRMCKLDPSLEIKVNGIKYVKTVVKQS